MPQHVCFSGAVARVLLFNATGERDSAAMLKLLVVSTATLIRTHSCREEPTAINNSSAPFFFFFLSQTCHFDFAVFCPNITEAIASCNAGEYSEWDAVSERRIKKLLSLDRDTFSHFVHKQLETTLFRKGLQGYSQLAFKGERVNVHLHSGSET